MTIPTPASYRQAPLIEASQVPSGFTLTDLNDWATGNGYIGDGVHDAFGYYSDSSGNIGYWDSAGQTYDYNGPVAEGQWLSISQYAALIVASDDTTFNQYYYAV